MWQRVENSLRLAESGMAALRQNISKADNPFRLREVYRVPVCII